MMIVTLILILLMLAVFWLDATRYLIPNWLVGCVLALYPFYLWLSPAPVDWIAGLGVAVAAFVVGLALYAGKVMGGGDVKLLAACCLWVGMDRLLDYVLLTALLGGALALGLIFGRTAAAYLWLKYAKAGTLPQLLERGKPIPYGLAIAGALLILIAQHKITGVTLPL